MEQCTRVWQKFSEYAGLFYPVFTELHSSFDSQSITSTFQAVLITDGSASYAVFIYQCRGMGWGGATIGWAYSGSVYEKHSLSGSNSASIGCEYSSNASAVIHKIGEEWGERVNLLQDVFLESCEPRVCVLCSFQIQMDVHRHSLYVAMDGASLKMLCAMVWTIVETTATRNAIAVFTYHSCIIIKTECRPCILSVYPSTGTIVVLHMLVVLKLSRLRFILSGCTKSQFTCANGMCESQDFVCDGFDDCGDNSDEEQDCSMFI